MAVKYMVIYQGPDGKYIVYAREPEENFQLAKRHARDMLLHEPSTLLVKIISPDNVTEQLAGNRANRYAITREHGLPSNIPHGASAYKNWGCRCEVCTEDAVAYNRELRQARRADGQQGSS